ncbi:hypothetical protein FKM82_005029 [Ascaphus truei]
MRHLPLTTGNGVSAAAANEAEGQGSAAVSDAPKHPHRRLQREGRLGGTGAMPSRHMSRRRDGVSSSQGELSERSGSTGSVPTSQGTSETISVTSDTEPQEQQVTELSRKRARASLSDLSTLEEIEGLTIRQLKEILARNFVNYSGCCEKWELVEKVNRLYRENEENRKSLENLESKPEPDKERLQLMSNEDNLCRICMDAVIDCVLLECGHMVTCTKCGKRMSECPICRQYVVRAVHVFKS